MPHQGSSEVEPGDLILPGGPSLLQVLEPGPMVGSYHWPPEGLTMFHDLLQVNSHFISDGSCFEGHD